MKKLICKHCKQEIKEYPAKIKSYSQWLSVTETNGSLYDYRNYVSRMEAKYGIEHIPDITETLRELSDENAKLKEQSDEYLSLLIDAYNRNSELQKYKIIYKKFESFIKQKVATKLDLPVTDITQALFALELKSQLIKQKFKL